jgi:hypothetical protein
MLLRDFGPYVKFTEELKQMMFWVLKPPMLNVFRVYEITIILQNCVKYDSWFMNILKICNLMKSFSAR